MTARYTYYIQLGITLSGDPVDRSVTIKLDQDLLGSFPEGYRHVAYLQSKNGFKVKNNLPGLSGPAVEKVYAEGGAWLAGSPKPGRATLR